MRADRLATEPMRSIGQTARESGVSAKMIRHYESIGLLPPARRTDANYRAYSDADLHTLRFIHRARGFGFSLDDIAQLLDLWRDRARPSANVKALAERHIDALRDKVQAMQAMIATLGGLVNACHGDHRPECPILDDLAAGCHQPLPTDRTARR